MKKIICDLPNASELINGIKFESTLDGAVISLEPVEDDVAAQFDGIPGYHLVDAEPAGKKSETAAEKKAREKAEKEAAAASAEKAAAEAAADQPPAA